jgi:hypothetical protein
VYILCAPTFRRNVSPPCTGQKIPQGGTNVSRWLLDCCHLLAPVPRSRNFLSCRWRRYVPPKRRFTQDVHSATSQKTAFFIVTAVKTSDLTSFSCVCFLFLWSTSGLYPYGNYEYLASNIKTIDE